MFNVFVHICLSLLLQLISISSSLDDSHENPWKLVMSILFPNKSSHSSSPKRITLSPLSACNLPLHLKAADLHRKFQPPSHYCWVYFYSTSFQHHIFIQQSFEELWISGCTTISIFIETSSLGDCQGLICSKFYVRVFFLFYVRVLLFIVYSFYLFWN